jgi:NAD(P)-dependent dehydrogenase (short-subunit alcohol dehydrogenase family)
MNTVVVTGPTGHLGSAIVARLLKSFNVIGISRTASSFKCDTCHSESRLGTYIPIDLDLSAVPDDCLVSLVDDCASSADSPLAGLVNNAFTAYPKSALSVDVDAVHSCAESLLGIHIRLSLALSELLKAGEGGSIVNIASMYGRVSPRPHLYSSPNSVNPILYGAFKAGLIQASRYLSSLLGPDRIRVNSVSYGPFPTFDVQSADPVFVRKLAAQTHLRRFGDPFEAAGVIAFLLSDESSYITGADIPVDGGWTAW